jgi:hypothetical protein
MILTLGGSLARGEVRFSSRPKAISDGGKASVSFAVSGPTDVEVTVLSADGKVVRHLAAGVLGGPNPPPEPLKPGLSQTLAWDGKADYGKPAVGGPFRIRVALGLGAKYDRVVSSNRQNLAKVAALGTGPDGTLYVLAYTWGAVWEGPQILAFNRDGTYQRMVLPYPAGLKQEQLRGITSFQLAGRPTPLLHDIRMGLYPDFSPVQPSNIGVSPDGQKLCLPCYGHHTNLPPSIAMLDSNGGCSADKLVVRLDTAGKRPSFAAFSCLAVSSDGQHLYAAGMKPHVYEKVEHCAVYRVKLPERTGLEPLFGDPVQPGKDAAHLGGAPRGLAVDGKGKLFIADYANDRVVVVGEQDGKFLGAIHVEKPDYVGVASQTGSLYVARLAKSSRIEIVKFSLPADLRACERKGTGTSPPAVFAAFPQTGSEPVPFLSQALSGAKEVCRTSVGISRPDCYSAAFDTAAGPVVAWVGDRFGHLARVEDEGTNFGQVKKISSGIEDKSLPECYLSVVVDRQRKEVYARNSTGGRWWHRFSEETGRDEDLYIPDGGMGGGKGIQLMPHPDGNLYGLMWPFKFFRWDRNGKPLAWDEPMAPTDVEARTHGEANKAIPPGELKEMTKPGRHVSFVPVSMVELPHTLGIRESDGHLFVFSPKERGRDPKKLHEYLPSGKRVSEDPIIWQVSDAAVGPKFDAAGNIYVAEAIRPKGWLGPPELVAHFKATGTKASAGPASTAAEFYGSILKFSPKGGSIEFIKHAAFRAPFANEPKLPVGLKALDAEFSFGGTMRPSKVIGAEWIHPGVGHVGLFGCNCENITFDVDPFGRVFYPDVALYRVGVLDASGNVITHFGAYGNAENMGQDSPAMDLKIGKPLPRGAQERQGTKSALADPDLAIAWLVGIGVTDNYAYLGDSLNRRLLRARFVYAVEETCEIK